jgi:hypothetical protein
MRKWGFFWIVFFWSLVGATAQAGTNDNAKIAGHLQPHSAKNSCTSLTPPPCNPGGAGLVVHGALATPYDLYLVVLDADSSLGVGAATFGISYAGAPQSGVDVFSWSSCTDLEFRGGAAGIAWPDSGSGNLVLWDRTTTCQRTPAAGDLDGGVTAVIGVLYVYAYSDDVFAITRRTYAEHPDFNVCDCRPSLTSLPYPQASGTVGFGNLSGSNPCQ